MTEGVYDKGLAGQVGLGIPASAAVTLHALTVTGEAVTLGHKLQKPVPIDYDGGLIDVLYDHHPQMLAWYTEHLGLKGNTWPGPVDRNADATLFSTLNLPDHGAFHLYSVLTRKRLAHWYSERGTVDGHVRFAFQCPDLARTHAYFKEQGIRTSEIAVGPQGREYFDFYDPEGTRLTAISYPDKAEKFPDARITNFAPFRIGVTDLSRSVGWYRELLGMAVEEDDTANGYVCMSGFLWLESVPPDQHVGQVDSPGRVYFVCGSRQQFTELYERLAQAGARPSAYMDHPGRRWTAFHCYDPDGNRLNFWSYF
jgi:catechol 2,3-dioxygenase-like lactoylglutathione lyase family enzyme